ncbi:acyltransferase family protein [Microcella sp.]|uniref:acyltransferase family protein n=1 Tax=Microcella sp. TaxID=1913979 RepID=UPI0025675957|nr:acyltransferase [Microcella sp.]MBX9472215.1 acyltransferase [Microcella sp.]
MTTFEQKPTQPDAEAPATGPNPVRASRDRAVDLTRAACLVVVVGLHVMMAGITVGTDGLAITNSLDGHPIFAWSTWIVQVMPLFFVMGGFSALLAWRRQRERGVLASTYVRDRVARLARPALLPLGLVGITLAVLGLIGLPDAVLTDVGFRIGQPLWFLAVYLGCAGLVPFMARLHERAPWVTLLGMLAAVMAVDTVALLTAQPLIGALNLLFVWVFIQQLGFCLADGWFDWRRRWLLLVGGLGAFGVLLFMVLVIGYSTDMYDNLNPPTAAILVLGVGQTLLFAWLRPWLNRLAQRETLAGLSDAINKNAMQIYLWHVPVIVLIAVVLVIAGASFPEPLSGEWWQSRPPFLIAVALLLIPIVIGVAWLERRGERAEAAPVGPWLAALKVLLGISGVVTILVAGFTPAYGAAIGVTLLLVAVLLRSPRKRRPVAADACAGGAAPE